MDGIQAAEPERDCVVLHSRPFLTARQRDFDPKNQFTRLFSLGRLWFNIGFPIWALLQHKHRVEADMSLNSAQCRTTSNVVTIIIVIQTRLSSNRQTIL